MAQSCSRCFAANPDEAVFCYRDGALLPAHVSAGSSRSGLAPFPAPFVFPSGQVCRNFDQLVLACQADWNAGVETLKSGQLARFFENIGRPDLAFNARAAANGGKNFARGLHNLLGTLPSEVLPPPRVEVPAEVSLPALQVGQDHSFDLRLVNAGGGLLFGSVQTDCPWLSLGGPGVVTSKAFEFPSELTLPVRVCGKALRACPLLKGQLHIASNGGEAVVEVHLAVPAKPFPHAGVLAGAVKLGDLLAKTAAAPHEAARFFDDDSVRQWYETNGWDYPIQGPTAAGVEGVRQFFHALHLDDPLAGPSPPPPSSPLASRVIRLHGAVGASLRHRLEIRGRSRGIRPVSVSATSDQPWLGIGSTHVNDLATVDLVVPSIPNRSGETLHARVTLTLNDTYRRVLPVSLAVTPPAGWPTSGV